MSSRKNRKSKSRRRARMVKWLSRPQVKELHHGEYFLAPNGERWYVDVDCFYKDELVVIPDTQGTYFQETRSAALINTRVRRA